VAKAEPLVIKLIIQGEKKLKPTEARLNKIKDLVNSIDKVSSNLFDGRSVKGGVKALDGLKKSLGEAAAGNRKFAENFSGLNRQLGKFQTIIKEAKIETQQFNDAIVAAERVQQKLFSARGAQSQALAKSYGKDQSGAGMIPGLMGHMDSSEFIKSRDALSNYRSELTRVFDAVEIGSENYKTLGAQIRKVDGLLGRLPKANKITGVGTGLAGKEQALKESLRLQNQLETGSDAHIKSIVGTRKAQQAYNQELRVSKTIQSALNLDLIVWKKLLDSVPAIVGKIAGGMKGLLTGKFGKLGQATGLVLTSKAIQEIIQKIPFLNQALKDNIQQWALLAQRAVEGITGITIAWTGLTGLLGGAQWVINAVTGFKKFESQAAESIWRTQRALKNFYESASAMAWMMQGKGGSPAGVGQLLKDMALGGEARQEKKRYEQQGPTGKEMIQKDLDLQITKLKQRNLNEADYIEILQRKGQLERQLRRENKKERVMRVKAGEPFEKVFEKEVSAHKSRVAKKLATEKRAEAEIETVRKKREKTINDQLVSKIKAIKQEEQEEIKALNRRIDRERKAEKQIQQQRSKRSQARMKGITRFGENVMLGAGFPMLFGGGPGAVAGGLTGAIGQSAMGSQGFGAQILFSAVGQQLDAFAQKARELGDALKRPSDALSALADMGIMVDEVFQKEVETLVSVGKEAEAMTMVNKELARTIGVDGVQKLKTLDSAWDSMGDQLAKIKLKIMTDLVPVALAVIKLVEKFVDSVDIHRVTGKAQELDPEAFKGAKLEANRAALEYRRKEIQNNPELSDWQKKMTSARMTMGSSTATRQFYDQKLYELSKEILRNKAPGILGLENTGKLGGDSTTGITIGDKNRALEEQIELLNRSFEIGSKAAGQEQEAAEILLEQNKLREEKLTLGETDILQRIEARDKLQEQLELWNQIKDTIATGLTSAIQGLIEGTKSLGESLGSIAKSIGSMLLQSAISSYVGGINFGGGTKVATGPTPPVLKRAQGGYMANGIKPFASGGLATRPTLGLVGEAGEDEYIIPASKMASSMQRYSAGARGEAVIPGTGSSYAGGGAGGSTTVNYSGPILNFNSEEFVPKSAVGQIIATATARGASVGESRTISSLRNSRSRRSSLGL